MSVTIPNSYKPREEKELLRCIENSDQIRVIEWDWVGEWKSYSIGLGWCDGAGAGTSLSSAGPGIVGQSIRKRAQRRGGMRSIGRMGAGEAAG